MPTELLDYAERCLARRKDPASSKMAAKQANSNKSKNIELFVAGLRIRGGRGTAAEAAAAVCDDVNRRDSIRRRQTECLRRGYVRGVGLVICSVKHTSCQCYEVIE
jgi:hypothetical protein